MVNTLKYFVIGVLILLIIGIVGASIFYIKQRQSLFEEKPKAVTEEPKDEASQEPLTAEQGEIDTSDWKTYENKKYRFRFKYPRVYDEYEDCRLREGENGFSLGNRLGMKILNSQGLTLFEYVNKYINENFEEGDYLRSKETSISERSAIIVTYRPKGMGRLGVTAFLEKDGEIYRFYFFAGPSCVKDILELATFHQILLTFEFTK